MARKLAFSVYLEGPKGPVCLELGTVPPDWAKGKIGDHAFEKGDVDDADGAPSAPSYASLTVNKLKAEIADRNEGRDDDDKIDPESERKPDLISALDADDEKAAGTGD